MELLVNVISVAVALNTVILTYLTYLYIRNKDNNVQDEGATDTEQEN